LGRREDELKMLQLYFQREKMEDGKMRTHSSLREKMVEGKMME